MDHRRGQRWRTKLAIRTTVDQAATPRRAWLLDLSYHGARLRLPGGGAKPGKTLAVWLPEMEQPIRALVVHCRGDRLGLLWIEYTPWVEHLLVRVVPQLPQPWAVQPIGGGAAAYAPKITVGFRLPGSVTMPYVTGRNR